MAGGSRKKIVVVGLGMVGISFIEKLLKLDARAREYDITVVGEEPHLAYNRVGLTSFFAHRQAEQLYLNPLSWYEAASAGAGADDGPAAFGWHLNKRVVAVDRARRTVTCADGHELAYDVLVLATGSDALLPRHTPGHDARGVFVYRGLDDLQRLIAFADTRKDEPHDGAVVGGGLLGLEAAKAMLDLGAFRRVRVVERNRWVLSRQLDGEAGAMVVEQVRALGVDVMLSKRVGRIETAGDEDGEKHVTGVTFEDGEYMPCSTICFAIGIRPRDELARAAGLRCADRGGGVVVGDDLRTSDDAIYAIGECASWRGQTYGLIGPGVEMADVLAFNLTQARLHAPRAFARPDLSTKLKLLGVEVASFGDFFADRDGPKHLPARAAAAAAASRSRKKKDEDENDNDNKKNNNSSNSDDVKRLTDGLPPPAVKALTYKDPFQNVYKKYIFTMDGKYLLGGMMIGDTRDYVRLVPLVKAQKPLDVAPSELILGKGGGGDEDGGDDLADDTQICSCHNVSKGDVVNAVRDGTCTSLGEVKSCTKAGTGCGGCMPLVTSLFNKTMAALGNEVRNNVCPHFSYSRADLYNIVMVRRLQTFADVMREAGRAGAASEGCEVCKPAVASILASLWNKHVLDPRHRGLQDTNDRFLGNIQRDGTFSVVPRVAAGEITPDRLIAMGEVARRYGLYTKITGGQRIDMFGAQKQDLPDIWRALVDAGMESGHAYAKSLRTVKSCVGSTWCRYGIGDSVGMAVRLEERYKSIRSPHKIKGGVSGCVRECAEAQSKDFGLIATEKGFNIFVGGNGGATPRHAELLAKDVAPADVVPILDRYLMLYIRTADRLQRTARWLEALPGGIAYLRDVVLRDSLGLAASLEAQMAELVDSYFDEWAEALRDPQIAARFRQFANTDERVAGVELEAPVLGSLGAPPVPAPAPAPETPETPESPAPESESQSPEQQQQHHPQLGQRRPAAWAREPARVDFAALRDKWTSTAWEPLLPASHFAGADDLPGGVSAAVKRGDTQLAVWRVRGAWYATQQMCPHKRAFVLSDGLVGEDPSPPTPPSSEDGKVVGEGGEGGPPSPSPTTPTRTPWVSCPHHKRNYDLRGGACRSDAELSIATFDVEARDDGLVYLRLPPVAELDAELGTSRWRVRVGEAGAPQLEALDKKIRFVGQRAKRPGVRPHVELPMRRPVELLMAGGGGGGGGGCGGGAGMDW